MNSKIDEIISADKQNWNSVLENFLKTSLDSFALPELNEGSKRKDVWAALYNIAKTSDDPKTIKNAFIAIRILSREKNHLNDVITDDWINLIKIHSGLDKVGLEFDSEICIEVLKSLSNILFNSRNLAAKSVNNGILDGLIERINKFEDTNVRKDIKFMDIRLLFLITALCPEARNKVDYMVDPLERILEDILKIAAENYNVLENHPILFLTDTQADLVSEILKALFNLTVGVDDSNPEILAKCSNLVKILRSYLLIPSMDLEKTWNLRSNVINLLTNMPDETYGALLVPCSGQEVLKSLEFEGQNMTAVYEILMFLKAKFNDELKTSNQHEVLSPVITVLLKGCSNRLIRKFIRIQILPPLKDVHSRPEEGNNLRNHLCRLLTTPVTQLRDLVAELLFVLCKKNVARMIKYTGYGNAAGLFAQRGLLAGGLDAGACEYSSDSEDSETEEYADHKHGINPVIGCYEEPHPSASANMSDEQKEYEARKLIELMDSLMKCGTIKPCVIGANGKPEPVEHVLQLREGLGVQKKGDDESD